MIDQNLKIAERYIDSRHDIDYRTDVKTDLVKQKDNFILVKEKLVQSMNVFENTLYLKLKKLLSYSSVISIPSKIFYLDFPHHI